MVYIQQCMKSVHIFSSVRTVLKDRKYVVQNNTLMTNKRFPMDFSLT